MALRPNDVDISISLLSEPCLLVHIPRSRLQQVSHHITKQLLSYRHGSFISITSNQIEMSIFAEEDSLYELVQIAQQDQREYKHSSAGNKRSKRAQIDAIEVSDSSWSVLVIESHEEDVGDSGARVQEISTLLAGAGISILYQSSYMSDFILVQTQRVNEAIGLLSTSGFSFYSTNPGDFTSQMSTISTTNNSPITSMPSSPTDDIRSLVTQSMIFGSEYLPPDFNNPLQFGEDDRIVMSSSRPRSSTNSSLISLPFSTSLLSISPLTPSHIDPPLTPPSEVVVEPLPSSRTTATLLPPVLAMVGLSEDTAEIWVLKLIKLLVYPELLGPPSQSRVSHRNSMARSKSAADVGSELDLQDDRASGQAGPNFLDALASPGEGGGTRSPSRSPSTASSASTSASSSSSPSSTYSSLFGTTPASNTATSSPFFSFTRTADGTSLTTDVYSLASLFEKHERHMLFCADELDAVDAEFEMAALNNEKRRTSWHLLGNPQDLSAPSCLKNAAAEAEAGQRPSTMQCLQIDLRAFELEKHGVVSHLSEILQTNGINHLYSSTFKTANVLVACADASKALELLNSSYST